MRYRSLTAVQVPTNQDGNVFKDIKGTELHNDAHITSGRLMALIYRSRGAPGCACLKACVMQ